MHFFDINEIELYEPKCPNCSSILKYGINTKFDKEKNSEICLNCGKEI